jgi:hypothetical protein
MRGQGHDRPDHGSTALKLIEGQHRAAVPLIGDVHEGGLGRLGSEPDRDEHGPADRHRGGVGGLARVAQRRRQTGDERDRGEQRQPDEQFADQQRGRVTVLYAAISAGEVPSGPNPCSRW